MSIPKINTDLTLKETLSKCGYCAVGSYFWMKTADQEIGAEPQWIKKSLGCHHQPMALLKAIQWNLNGKTQDYIYYVLIF